LAAKDGLDAIRFEAADAEALPYPDGRFDVAFCSTVLEEGDAQRMVAELARVIRPGGRVAVLTRAVDLDWSVNLPVPHELKSRLGALGPATGAGVGDRGCADASLYARLASAGLALSVLGPQFAIYRDGERLADVLDRLLGALPPDDLQVCRTAVKQANAAGTLFVAEPFHCAIGTKSGAEFR
jgi:SAM-dependent methyltransferase